MKRKLFAMDYRWIVEHKAWIMLLIFAFSMINQCIYYRHLRQRRFEEADVGYFWRLWRQGNMSGRIIVYSTFIMIALGLLLVISMVKAS